MCLESTLKMSQYMIPILRKFDPLRSPNRCTGEKVDVECQYINTLVDMSKSTFREAIEKQHYRVNECWANCLYDHYRDTLLSTDKSRNVVSRAMILDTVGRTEHPARRWNLVYGALLRQVSHSGPSL